MSEASDVIIAAFSMVSGLGIAYIVNVQSKKVQSKKAKNQPKDRMEQMFDGYERFIQRQDIDIERKQQYINVIEKELALTKEHVKRLENALASTKSELVRSRDESEELRQRLNDMRIEYKHVKVANKENENVV